MAVLQIVRLLAAAAASASSGTGAANLITPDPKEVWVAGATGNVSLTLDLGSKCLIDTLIVSGTNAPIGALFNVKTANAADLSDASYAAQSVPVAGSVRIGGRAVAVASFAARFVRYVVFETANIPAATTLQAGVLAAGLSLSPSWGHEWGGGRGVVDTGARERLIGGGFGVQGGARKPVWRWTLADLTDPETQLLDEIVLDRGETRPLVVIEDPALAEVTVTAQANATVAGRSVSKSGGVGGTWDSLVTGALANAMSLVSFRGSQTNKALAMGLHTTAAAANASVISYSIWLDSDGSAYVVEGGATRGVFGTYTTTDLFAVTDDGATISYWKNGAVFYRTAKTLNQALYFNGGFSTAAGAIADLVVAPAGLAERVHYGLLDRLEPYERRAPYLTKWGLSIEEWT